jgi:uncharacterized protein (TIGR02594 family)
MHNKMLAIALEEYGVTEVPGAENNPRILEYSAYTGLSWVKDDETSWCGIAMAFCAKSAMLPIAPGFAKARNWLKWGVEVKQPKLGDIVVFWRDTPHSWKGHVGLFVNQLGNEINVLGGNQGDKFCIAPYPASRVLGYRRAEQK